MNHTTTNDATTTNPNGSTRADRVAEFTDVAKEKLSSAASSAAVSAKECGTHFVAEPAQDLFGLLQDYAKSKPDVAAMWCFGLGVIIGWKLRR